MQAEGLVSEDASCTPPRPPAPRLGRHPRPCRQACLSPCVTGLIPRGYTSRRARPTPMTHHLKRSLFNLTNEPRMHSSPLSNKYLLCCDAEQTRQFRRLSQTRAPPSGKPSKPDVRGPGLEQDVPVGAERGDLEPRMGDRVRRLLGGGGVCPILRGQRKTIQHRGITGRPQARPRRQRVPEEAEGQDGSGPLSPGSRSPAQPW